MTFQEGGKGRPDPHSSRKRAAEPLAVARLLLLTFLFLSEKMSLPPPAGAARPDSSWPGLGPCLFKGRLG